MNYDRLRQPSHLTASTGPAGSIAVEDGAVEEEQVAAIQTVQVLRSNAAAGLGCETAAAGGGTTSTPQRKISTSSRFMNAFQQLVGATSLGAGTVAITSTENNDVKENHPETAPTNISTTIASATSAAANRTPTKGMEAKLLSMWHNVKYGWSGKIKSSFSKEQPVWLLGRCYHRKLSPLSSMETSMELNASGIPASHSEGSGDSKNFGYIASAYETLEVTPSKTLTTTAETTSSPKLYPSLNVEEIDEIVVPQELGMDAVENQIAEHPWEEGIEGFRRDFYSRLWMTYRREFPIMNGSNYTSDCGWGCMLRSGQMLLAQGLICHFLGRGWRFDPETQLHSTYEDNMHKKIVKWFGDSSSKSSPFSIHALVSLGEEMGKKPGDWYGPASVSYLLKRALKCAAQENADFDNIAIYVARECTIYMQDVEIECSIPDLSPKKKHVPWQSTKNDMPKLEKPQSTKHWKSLIVLIPLRLGTEKINPAYAHCLKLLLSTEYCIGIIGGRPKHSLYFVGFQEDKLIHLDPHYCQEMVDVNQENFPLHTFHCKSPRKLRTSKLDPSCCIGFYCATKTDFENFAESVQMYLNPMRCASGSIERQPLPQQSQSQPLSTSHTNNYDEINYPLFSFSRGRCMENEKDEMSDSLYKPCQRQLAAMNQQEYGDLDNRRNNAGSASAFYNNCDDDDGETEEFVLL